MCAALAPTFDSAPTESMHQSAPTPESSISIDLLADNNRAIAEKLGRKLSLKERIALSFVRGKLKKTARKGTAYDPDRRDGMPVVSLVLGILSILGLGIFLIFPVLAIVFGAASLRRNRYVDQSRYNMAIWGIILGSISLLFIFIVLLAILAVFASF